MKLWVKVNSISEYCEGYRVVKLQTEKMKMDDTDHHDV